MEMKPKNEKRLSVPLTLQSHEDLAYISKTMGETKAAILKDVLGEVLPELRTYLEETERLKAEGNLTALSSAIASRFMSHLSTSFGELAELQKKH